MTEGAPQIPAAEYVIPFVPDTKPVMDFLDTVEQRVAGIVDKLAQIETPDARRGEIEAFPAESERSDVVADEPRHEGLGNDNGDLRRAIEENTSSIDELRDDIESLTSVLAALVEALGGGS